MTTEEKRTDEILNDLHQLPKVVVYRLCANLIFVAEPEKFKWKELKKELSIINGQGTIKSEK